jgi:hypothetical protein
MAVGYLGEEIEVRERRDDGPRDTVRHRGNSCRAVVCWSGVDGRPTAADAQVRRRPGVLAGGGRIGRRPAAVDVQVSDRSQADSWGVLAGGAVLGSRRQAVGKEMFFL